MHAYLLIGTNDQELDSKTKTVTQKLAADLMEFPLSKIEDVRALSRFTRLKLGRPTAIYIKGIEDSTHEALNAFLKSLEEPQENLIFILTASSQAKVLPTIVSRCQVIYVKSEKLKIKNEQAQEFEKMSADKRLVFVDEIKKREEATEFLNELISFWHKKLVKGEENYQNLANKLKKTTYALNALYSNGNVLLQLTNFVISIS